MKDALATALNGAATFVPQLVLFLVILLIGVLVAKVLSKAVNKVLERARFDRAIERGGAGKALEQVRSVRRVGQARLLRGDAVHPATRVLGVRA